MYKWYYDLFRKIEKFMEIFLDIIIELGEILKNK